MSLIVIWVASVYACTWLFSKMGSCVSWWFIFQGQPGMLRLIIGGLELVIGFH